MLTILAMLLRLAVILLLQLGPSLAAARSESKLLAYPRENAWPTAVRFIAVDERAKILDKDPDAGYLLFELRDDGKYYRGSLELVGKPDGVRFVITIPDRPSWMEIGMLTRLEAKLRAELGAPNPPKPPKREEPKPEPDKDKEKAPDPKDGKGPDGGR